MPLPQTVRINTKHPPSEELTAHSIANPLVEIATVATVLDSTCASSHQQTVLVTRRVNWHMTYKNPLSTICQS